MAKPKKADPAGQKPNHFSIEDLKSIIDEMEEVEAEKRSTLAKQAGEIAGVKQRFANMMLEHKKDESAVRERAAGLGIPREQLNAALEQRELERKLMEIPKKLSDDSIEVYLEMSGQFSILPPLTDEEVGKSNVTSPLTLAAKRAAKEVLKQRQEQQVQEQKEGEAMLAQMNGGADA